MARKKTEAFDLPRMKEADRKQLATDLCDEIEEARNQRVGTIGPGGKIDLLDWYYEQGQTPLSERPFIGAADLTSYIITEGVDALKSRIDKAVLRAEPFCVVEGWGDASKRAPAVEAFHDWQIHEEGLLPELNKAILGALIEDCYILEVRPRVETRLIIETLDVAIETGDMGGQVFDHEGRPVLKRDERGDYLEAKPGEASAKIEVQSTKVRQLGPEYDLISMKDFVYLPGHAKNQKQVFGHAYRFKMRWPEIQERAKDGIYDKSIVDAMSPQSDIETGEGTMPPTVDGPTEQRGAAAEKELYQLSLKRDLDGDGREEWYLITLSLKERVILRLKRDKFVDKVGRTRCVPFVLFPRRDSVYGYSFAEKLLTLAEEHTSLRNMKADRGALATNAPMMQQQGGLWNPEEQPIGIRSVITVRDHNELKPLIVPDVPNSIVEQERALIMAVERVRGLSDMGAGVQASSARTLGENQMVNAGSAIRVDEPISHMRGSIEHLMDLRQAMWLDAIEADKGLEAPADVREYLEARGVADFDGRFTADMLKGKFRFKPYGSTDTADVGRRIQYFTESMVALLKLIQAIPGLAVVLQDPEVQKLIMQEWAQAYKQRNGAAFLRALMRSQQMPQPGLPQAGGMDAAGQQQQEQTAPQGGGTLPIDAIRAMLTQGGNA